MARNLTGKQRGFVDAYLANGRNATAAYRTAYGGAACARTQQRRGGELLRHPRIMPLIEAAERQAAAATQRVIDRYEVSVERVLGELARLGFANMGDFMQVGADGDPWLDFSKLTRDQTAALVEVTVEDFKDGRGAAARDVRRVKFKLADKRAALVDLGRHLGMFVERREVGKPGAFDDLTQEQKRERAIGLAKQLGIDRIGGTA